MVTRVWEKGQQKGISFGDGIVPYLDCGDGKHAIYMPEFIELVTETYTLLYVN